MLRIADRETRPLDVSDLLPITRENGRSFADYEFILDRLKLPGLQLRGGLNILEVGTGLGCALMGAMSAFGPNLHMMSVDINAPVLDRIKASSHLPIAHISTGAERSASARPAVDLLAASIESAELPAEYFDLAYSIWVLYQVRDKVQAIKNVLEALRPGAPFILVGGGSICTLSEPPSTEVLEAARDFVWNNRASRFSWLNGTRELTYVLGRAGINHRVEPLDDFLSRRLRIDVELGRQYPEFPAGSLALRRPAKLADPVGLSLVGFVSTRTSAIIPIYVDVEFHA